MCRVSNSCISCLTTKCLQPQSVECAIFKSLVLFVYSFAPRSWHDFSEPWFAQPWVLLEPKQCLYRRALAASVSALNFHSFLFFFFLFQHTYLSISSLHLVQLPQKTPSVIKEVVTHVSFEIFFLKFGMVHRTMRNFKQQILEHYNVVLLVWLNYFKYGDLIWFSNNNF